MPIENIVESDEEVLETIPCKGVLYDKYIGDSETVVSMLVDRGWEYELQDIVIIIYRDEVTLRFNALVKTLFSQAAESYQCYASGTFVNGVAHLVYRFDDNAMEL